MNTYLRLSRRDVISAGTARLLLGVTPAGLRRLVRIGELTIVERARDGELYDRDEVVRLAYRRQASRTTEPDADAAP